MKLNEIASVSGKGGLFRIVANTKSGLIMESLDTTRTKVVASANQRISILHEISIYTNTKEGTVQLDEVLRKINKEFGNDPGVDADSDSAELRSFMKSILPEYDENRVYTSDIKKLVKWYAILVKEAPEVLKEESSGEAEQPKA